MWHEIPWSSWQLAFGVIRNDSESLYQAFKRGVRSVKGAYGNGDGMVNMMRAGREILVARKTLGNSKLYR